MRFLEADVIPVLGELSLSETDRLLMTFLMRAMTTFEAMIELAEHGFGEQAAMLDRSLFEQMLDTHWVADNADEAKELLRDHEMLTRGEFVAASKRHPEFFPLPVDGVGIPGDEELDALRRRFSKGGMSWTGLRFQERLAAVKAKWPPETRDSLAYFADVPYKINNLWLHPSPFAMHSVVEHEGDTLHLRYGPSGNYVEPALFSGVWGIGQIVTLIFSAASPRR